MAAQSITKALGSQFKLGWKKLGPGEDQKVLDYGEKYKAFLNASKTERLCAENAVEMAKKAGFKSLDEVIQAGEALHSGDKIYALHRDKSVLLFRIGSMPLEQGMLVIGAHLDCPRLDLKPMPLYEDANIAYFKTHYYGGIKKYPWLTLPLALYGRVIQKDGKVIPIAIGDQPEDPVFCISDLLPHLSQKLNQKKVSDAFEGEQLNPMIASRPLSGEEDGTAIKATVLKYLNDHYGMTEEDFASAELEIVPAGQARDIGFDRSMILSFGQDDRICAYAALSAMLEAEDQPQRTQCVILADKEEIGSYGNTGMQSRFFENALAELAALQSDASNSLAVRRCLSRSFCLSADVTAAYDPNFPDTHDMHNATFFGKGVAVNKYGGARGKSGGSDANPEFIAKLRKCFDDNGVTWQLGEMGKIDLGGGGTIAYMLAAYDMEVVDCGTPILSMHAPWEQSSKIDAYMTYKAYRSFFNHFS
ncbi:MAG: aminopeptidase [Pseudoramibacter sp.]